MWFRLKLRRPPLKFPLSKHIKYQTLNQINIMPCSDGGPSYVEDPETKRRLDKVTQLLCGVCKQLSLNQSGDYILGGSTELSKWWAEHQEADREALVHRIKQVAYLRGAPHERPLNVRQGNLTLLYVLDQTERGIGSVFEQCRRHAAPALFKNFLVTPKANDRYQQSGLWYHSFCTASRNQTPTQPGRLTSPSTQTDCSELWRVTAFDPIWLRC